MTDFAALLPRLDALLDRLAASTPAAPDWKTVRAARWSARDNALKPILHPQRVALKDLLDIDEQKQRVDANTRQFVQGRPANNVLLTGARGGGKSSLVKAVHAKYAAKGLRLIEVDKAGPPAIVSSSSSTTSALPSTNRVTPASRPRSMVRLPGRRTTC